MTADTDPRKVIFTAVAENHERGIRPTVDAVVTALADAGLSITATPAPLRDVRDNEGNYYGKQGTPHEHRTVGDYRAWCYDAHEWCYPSGPCHLCKDLSDV